MPNPVLSNDLQKQRDYVLTGKYSLSVSVASAFFGIALGSTILSVGSIFMASIFVLCVRNDTETLRGMEKVRVVDIEILTKKSKSSPCSLQLFLPSSGNRCHSAPPKRNRLPQLVYKEVRF